MTDGLTARARTRPGYATYANTEPGDPRKIVLPPAEIAAEPFTRLVLGAWPGEPAGDRAARLGAGFVLSPTEIDAFTGRGSLLALGDAPTYTPIVRIEAHPTTIESILRLGPKVGQAHEPGTPLWALASVVRSAWSIPISADESLPVGGWRAIGPNGEVLHEWPPTPGGDGMQGASITHGWVDETRHCAAEGAWTAANPGHHRTAAARVRDLHRAQVGKPWDVPLRRPSWWRRLLRRS